MADELVQLASIYGEPGFLLLATDDQGERLGCVGLRDLGLSNGVRVGEIRRLFVRAGCRSGGLGGSLLEGMTSRAVKAGFDRVVLNTLPSMVEAVGLYRAHGFETCDPYVESPIEDTLYLSLELPGT